MTIIEKIEQLNAERGWSLYELSKRTNIAEATIYTWKRKNKAPSIPVLEKICSTFGITLYQFFQDIGDNRLTDEQKEVLSMWSTLEPEEKTMIKNFVEYLRKIKNS